MSCDKVALMKIIFFLCFLFMSPKLVRAAENADELAIGEATQKPSLQSKNIYHSKSDDAKILAGEVGENNYYLLAQNRKRSARRSRRHTRVNESGLPASAPLRRGSDIRPALGIWTGTDFKGGTIFLIGGDFALHDKNLVYLGGLLYSSVSDKGDVGYGVTYSTTVRFINIDGGAGYKIGLSRRSWLEFGARGGINLASYTSETTEPPGSFDPFAGAGLPGLQRRLNYFRKFPSNLLGSDVLNESDSGSETFVTLAPYASFSYLIQRNLGFGAEIRKPIALSGGKDSIELAGFYFLAKLHYILK